MSDSMFAVSVAELAIARGLSHAAVQPVSRAARANLNPEEDDSHSNLGWEADQKAMTSRPLDPSGRYRLGFSFEDASLVWLDGNTVRSSIPIADGNMQRLYSWCDDTLSNAGLRPTADATMPYELPAADFTGSVQHQPALSALGAWYDAAHIALSTLRQQFGDRVVLMPEPRCWPHHFDLAVLFSLEQGDPETARSIGVGMSPGDGSYDMPYFYCSPWPAPSTLPSVDEPLTWHTEGFTSIVCTASVMDASTDITGLLADAFQTAEASLR
ncbi:MAG: hypothetical protein AAF525_19710 [Pseudomonadota bacterium]